MCGIVTISFKLWFSGPPFCLVNLAMLVLRSKIAPALKVFRSKHEPSLTQAPPAKWTCPKCEEPNKATRASRLQVGPMSVSL